MTLRRFLPFLLLAFVCLMPFAASAQSFSINLGGDDVGGGSSTGRILQIIALLTVLSLAPGILIMVTSFTRVVVVLSLLRAALGGQQTPPNMVIVSLAMFLTAPIAGFLAGRLDLRLMMGIGFAGFAAGTWTMSQLTADWDFWELLVPQVLLGREVVHRRRVLFREAARFDDPAAARIERS